LPEVPADYLNDSTYSRFFIGSQQVNIAIYAAEQNLRALIKISGMEY